MKYKILNLTLFFVLSACIDDTHNEIIVSEVNIETLKKVLIKQKCHNKAIFIFNPACSTCMYYLEEEYPIMRNKFLDSIDYVFISVDTIPLEKYKSFFHNIGIKAGQLFVLCEDNPAYLYINEKIDISKVMQYLFSNERIYIQGFPVSTMVNRENKIKLEYYPKSNSSSIIIRPQPWHRLYMSNLCEIDFDVIDDNCNN